MDEKRRATAAQNLAGLEKSECVEHSRWDEYTKYAGALSMRKMLNKTLSTANARKISGTIQKIFGGTQNPFGAADFAKNFTSELDDDLFLKIMPP